MEFMISIYEFGESFAAGSVMGLLGLDRAQKRSVW
jgi:hypothetical protein